MKKTENGSVAQPNQKNTSGLMSNADAREMALQFSRINDVIGRLEHSLEALLDEISGVKDDTARLSVIVSSAIKGKIFDMFVELTGLLVRYGDFAEPPDYDVSGVYMRLERLIKRRFVGNPDARQLCCKLLTSASYLMNFPPNIIGFGLIEGLTEDCHDLFELLVREEKPTPAPAGGRKSRRIVEEPPIKSREYGRFTVAEYTSTVVIADCTPGKAPYRFRKSGWAYKGALELVKRYAAGMEQLYKSNAKLRGAFQKGRGDAERFRREQVFKLPRWNEEMQRYMDNQYDGRWRLWTDDEILLPERKRVAAFKRKHPRGTPLVT